MTVSRAELELLALERRIARARTHRVLVRVGKVAAWLSIGGVLAYLFA